MALNPLLKKLAAQTEARQAKEALIEAFMRKTTIKYGWHEETPAEMLRSPGADIGMADVAEEWVDQIIDSDEPDAEFGQLIDHLTGVLMNVELVRKHFRKQFETAA
ncbi:hypothetical protein [Rhodobacter sp. SY28-1]|uniref:hypothetical protein n=1 Tax=Rhodobacter sp. SY28-1 TaxID=2562317 RepID=UPI0010BFCDA5|nr:hypothetical protein [Rhodobacter sp. SY28-1]